MYKLLHNGQAFNLGKSTLPVEWINSWFSEEENKHNADFTWQFNLPYTPENKAMLGALAEPQFNTDVDEFIMCAIEIGGDVKPLRLYVDSVSTEEFKVRCILNEGGFDVMEKDINKLNLALDSAISVYLLTNAVYPDSFHNAIYPSAQVCFPTLISQDFLANQEPEYLGKINAYSAADGKYLNNYLDFGVAKNRNAMAPQPFLYWILERGFQEMGLKPTGEAWEAEFMRRLFLFSNYAVEDFDVQTQVVKVAEGVYSNASGQLHMLDKTILNGIDFTSGTNFDTSLDAWPVNTTGKLYLHLDLTFKRKLLSDPNPEHVKLNLYNTNLQQFIRLELTGDGETLSDGQYSFDWTTIIPEQWDSHNIRFYLSDDLGNAIIITDITVTITQESSQELNTFGSFAGFTKGLPSITFGELITELGKPPFGIKFEYNFRKAEVEMTFKSHSLLDKPFVEVDRSVGHEVERNKLKYHWVYDEPNGDRFLDDLRPEFLAKGLDIADRTASLVEYKSEVADQREITQAIVPIAQSLGNTRSLRIEAHAQSDHYATDGEAPSPRVGFYHGKVNDLPRGDIYFVQYTNSDLFYYTLDHTESLDMFDRTILPWLKWRTNSLNIKVKLLPTPLQLAEIVSTKRINLQWGPAILNKASADLDRDSRRIELDADIILL